MTQEEIIAMAREAGLEQVVAIDPKNGGIITKSLPPELLERFAVLVAAHEREQCAKVCDEYADAAFYQFEERGDRFDDGESNGATGCAAAIRARGDK